MKRFAATCVLLAITSLPATVFSQWVNIGDGIDYQEFTAAGPNNLFVSRLTRSNSNAIIDTSVANNRISSGVEIVRNQAARQDDALSWWGGSWGATTKVVAAVNGGFWDIGGTNIITGGQIQSGWYIHSFLDPNYPNATNAAFSGFSWKTDRTAFHGECVSQTGTKVFVKFMSGGSNMPINGININPVQVVSNKLYIYTPQYSNQTPSASRTEVLVEMTRPNLTTSGSGYSSGTIRSVKTNTGSTWIPFDHLVLSADSTAGTTLKNNSVVGSEVRIFQELIESNEPDVQGNNACQTPTGVNWANVFACINTNYHFLKNNVVRVPDAVAHPGYIGYVNLNPRTAICWNSSYVFFVVCDGRSSKSVGMSCATLGNWAKSVLGATDGVNLDGGGSSTMVVNGSVMNDPSDGNERAVCNGIMMVNVKPKQVSTQFNSGQTIFTTAQASCRLGPGTNYGIISTIAANTQGTIVAHNINGIYAKGYYWWKCDLGGTVGWVAQSLLTATPGSTPPSITQQPSNQTVGAGGIALFTVAAIGDGTLNYQWQKNSANLSNGGHYSGATTATLTISSCDSSDAADYRCVVSSTYGTATSNTATLTVGPPSTDFIVESRSGGQNFGSYSEIGTWGDNISYKSSAPGCTAGIGHRWCTIGATPVSATFAFTPSVGGTYEIFTTNCTTSNSGNPLIHKVTHSGGTTNVGVCQNTTCSPNAVNVWYSLGQYELNAGTPYSVTLDGSTAAGSSPAGNAGRSDAIKWSLMSASGPTIIQHPSNQSISPGSSATFAVAATGTGQLSYQWQKNQSNLSDGGHYSGTTTATLTVSTADTNDAANYRCKVTDNKGSVISNEATLAIITCSNPVLTNGNFEASTATTPPLGWTTYTQSGVSGSWTLQTVNPPEGLRWQQTQVYNVNSYGGVRQNVTALSSGGVYTISGWFKTNSISATASVRYSLSGNTDRTASTALASTSSTDWGTFSGSITATGSSMMLFLDHMNGTSSNKAGAFDNIQVIMTNCPTPTAPSITQQPSAQSLCPDTTASFSVAATGDAPLSYQWQKNTANLANSGHYAGVTTATLAIANIDSNDAANYRCVVSNGGGSATSNQAALTLKAVTDITQQPIQQSVVSGGTANFSIAATGNGTLTYQWQKNSANLANGGHYSGVTSPTLTVSNVDTSDQADYRCIVAAGCGSATSNNAPLTIKPPVPGDFDGDGDVDAADLSSFAACAIGPEITQNDTNCVKARLDADDDVDMDDFAIFQRCWSGENIPGDSNCAD